MDQIMKWTIEEAAVALAIVLSIAGWIAACVYAWAVWRSGRQLAAEVAPPSGGTFAETHPHLHPETDDLEMMYRRPRRPRSETRDVVSYEANGAIIVTNPRRGSWAIYSAKRASFVPPWLPNAAFYAIGLSGPPITLWSETGVKWLRMRGEYASFSTEGRLERAIAAAHGGKIPARPADTQGDRL